MEEFRKIDWIKGLENYSVSNYGRVRNDRFNRIVKCKVNRYGYVQAHFRDENKKHLYPLVHQLVARAFIGEVPSKMCVDHIDRDKTNNHVENLRYVSRAENYNNSVRPKKYNMSKVQCVETGEIFKNTRIAADANNCSL